jgi:hypothetical protein
MQAFAKQQNRDIDDINFKFDGEEVSPLHHG